MAIKSPRSLIIFVRRPELGKVKTRLAAEVGDEKALSIYIRLLEHTKDASLQVDCSRLLWYVDQIDHDDMWSSDDFEKHEQIEGDLGERMKEAFAKALINHNKAIIIGSDCPKLSSEVIEEAFSSLEKHDTVIGPTYDGGYYLLGMKKLHVSLFDNMRWSVDDVFDNTIDRIRQNSLSYHELPILSDVDYKEDWDKHGLD